MLRIEASACIDASVDRVWHWLSRLDDLPLWSEVVVSARTDPSRSRGVGAERVCMLRGGVTLVERWSTWDERHSYTYEGTGLPLVRSASNTWTLEPVGDRTLLTTEAVVTVAGGVFGRLLEPLIGWQARRLGRRSLAALAYLVEHDRPALGRHARLPAVASTC